MTALTTILVFGGLPGDVAMLLGFLVIFAAVLAVLVLIGRWLMRLSAVAVGEDLKRDGYRVEDGKLVKIKGVE